VQNNIKIGQVVCKLFNKRLAVAAMVIRTVGVLNSHVSLCIYTCNYIVLLSVLIVGEVTKQSTINYMVGIMVTEICLQRDLTVFVETDTGPELVSAGKQ
jgi:hypothetical protein